MARCTVPPSDGRGRVVNGRELEAYALGLDDRLRELEARTVYLEALIRTFAGQS